jgi:acetylornithine deacetylase/succinyl-diaminopimelate desuccinylase-like protein
MIGPFREQDFLDLHRLLATTPGPSLNEAPRRAVLEKLLQENGLSGQTDAAGNLWVALGPEGDWENTVVFDAHIDVVEKGFTPEVRVTEKHLTGLGVGDDLVAVTMLALAAYRLRSGSTPLRRPLKILFSVGEEGLGNLAGVRQMVADYAAAPRLFVAFDGTLDTYSISGLGSRRYRIEFQCAGGHSWGDFGAPSATAELVEFLHELRAVYSTLAATTGEAFSFNIGTVEGGEGINSISRRSRATFEFRSGAPEMLDQVARHVHELVDTFVKKNGVASQLTEIGERPAARAVDPERIRALVEPILRRYVVSPQTVIMSTNINVPLAHGWPAVRIGLYRGGNAHREDEQVERSSLAAGWSILDTLCRELREG